MRTQKQKQKQREASKRYYYKYREKVLIHKKEYRQKDEVKSKHNEDSKRFYEIHKKEVSKYKREFLEKHPERTIARNLAKKIKIPLNQICEICKKRLATEKHHPDYSKPLEVKFVCKHCYHPEGLLK